MGEKANVGRNHFEVILVVVNDQAERLQIVGNAAFSSAYEVVEIEPPPAVSFDDEPPFALRPGDLQEAGPSANSEPPFFFVLGLLKWAHRVSIPIKARRFFIYLDNPNHLSAPVLFFERKS